MTDPKTRKEAIRQAHDEMPTGAIQEIAYNAAKATWETSLDAGREGDRYSIDVAIMTQVNVITHIVTSLLCQWKLHEEPGSDAIQGRFKDTLSICLKSVQNVDAIEGKIAVVNVDDMTVNLVPMDSEQLAHALHVQSLVSGT